MKTQLTVLGCWAGGPQQGQAASGYLIETATGHVLVDCGPGVVLALSAHDALPHVQAVVISHRHADHCADLLALAYRRCFPNPLPPLPLYGPPDLQLVLTGLDTLFGIPSLPELAQPLSRAFAFRPVEPGAAFRAAGLAIETAAVQHPVPTLALRWPELGLAYTADSAHIPELTRFVHGAATLLAECTYLDGTGHDLLGHGHMTAAQAGMLAQEAQVDRLVLTHFADTMVAQCAAAIAAQQYRGAVITARAGLRIDLNCR